MGDSPLLDIQRQALQSAIVEVLKTVFDPEVPVSIYEMGLIYDIAIQPEGNVHIKMTLTTPACPVAGSLPGEVETRVRGVQGVTDVEVELVWDPPWSPESMSEAAKLQLGMDLAPPPTEPRGGSVQLQNKAASRDSQNK